jgi:hypothetical protein
MVINRQPFSAGFSSFNFTNPLWASNGTNVTGGVCINSTNVSIPPNAFLVLGFPVVTNCFFYPATNLTLPLNFTADINSSYRVAWNGKYYDGALGGIIRQSKVLSAINSPKWSGSCPGFVGESLAGTFWNMSGDPRATIYQSQAQSAISYDTRSSFGGRNYRDGLTDNAYGEVKPSLWPDGGHDSPKGNLPPGGVNTAPTTTPSAAYTNCPPYRISSGVGYTNVVELGNVFDPIQWFDSNGKGATTGYGSDGGQWTNLTFATATASNAFGGGTTLRVGRAEYGSFAFTNFGGNSTPSIPHMGASSAALLDLFCTTNGNTSGGPFRTGGKINLNTAPAPVLRALAGGINLTNDPANGTLAVPKGMAEAFAQGVMRFRSQYPFLTTSHLCFIGTDPAWPNTGTWPANSVFGNRDSVSLSTVPGNALVAANIGTTAWDDEMAEEWFSKIYNLSSVSSENYRVYIVAQLVDTNMMPTSPTIRKYVQFAGRPDTTTSGSANNPQYGTGVDMWHWNITKGLKKVYESPY